MLRDRFPNQPALDRALENIRREINSIKTSQVAADEDKIWKCSSDVTVNKAVYFSDVDEVSIASNDANPFYKAVGFVKEKITPTTCKIQSYGTRGLFTGITSGTTYFLGIDGEITATIPTSGMVQVVGIGINSSTIKISTEALYVKLAT